MFMLENLEPPVEEPADVQALRKALVHAQRDLLKAKDRTEHLVEVTRSAAFDAMLAMGKVPPVTPPKADKRKSQGEHALWVMTDWQGAKRTTSYNTEVMRQRVMLFTEKL
jgi:chemotaxis regulatin CheY-phosphate phosphatase CheZ